MVKNLRQDVKSTDVCNHVSKDDFKERKFYTLMKGFGETDLPDGKRRKLKVKWQTIYDTKEKE